MLYRFLVGKKPFDSTKRKSISPRELDKNVVTMSVVYPDSLDDVTVDFLKKLLEKDVNRRLGSNGGIDEIKAHDFWNDFDFGLLEAGCIPLPVEKNENFFPKKKIPKIHQMTYENVIITQEVENLLQHFPYKPKRAIQREVLSIFEHLREVEPNFFQRLIDRDISNRRSVRMSNTLSLLKQK